MVYYCRVNAEKKTSSKKRFWVVFQLKKPHRSGKDSAKKRSIPLSQKVSAHYFPIRLTYRQWDCSSSTVPCWRETTQIPSSLSCSPVRVKGVSSAVRVRTCGIFTITATATVVSIF